MGWYVILSVHRDIMKFLLRTLVYNVIQHVWNVIKPLLMVALNVKQTNIYFRINV